MLPQLIALGGGRWQSPNEGQPGEGCHVDEQEKAMQVSRSLSALSAVALASVLCLAPGMATAKSSGSVGGLDARAAPSGIAPMVGNVVYAFDVSGIFSVDAEGSPLNSIRTINVGADSRVVGIGWDVTLTAFAPSWLSEMVVNFGSSSVTSVNLTVGIGDDSSGAAPYSSGGIVNLVDLGFDFVVGPDGLMRMEFFESFDDAVGANDGQWLSGTLSIEVTPIPEPTTYGLMALGLLGVAAAVRRRRQDD